MTALWAISKGRPTKQSNFGRYRTLVYRGEGIALQSVCITADTPELATEIASNAVIGESFLNFVRTIAGIKQDGEEDENGNPWIMENNDAIATVNDLIDTARNMLETKGIKL